MTRRHFINHLAAGFKTMLLMRLLAPLTVMADEDGIAPQPLHYTPLNGRSLLEIAERKRHHGQGRYLNPIGLPRDGRFWELLRWKFSGNAFDTHLDQQPVVPVDIDWSAVTGHRGLSITFIKHAGLMIKTGQQHIFVDPVFDDIGFFIKDFTPRRFDLADLPRADHILITHGHYDHLDKPSLERFPKDSHIISPLGYNGVFDDLQMNNRQQLDWFDRFESTRLRVTLLPANHWTMRNPIEGPNRSLWGSYLIETAEGYTIYLSGDTAYFDGFDQIGDMFDIDLAVFNLGAYEPRWFMAQSHTNPAETVRAFQALKARKLMIVHWGTFRLGDEPVHFPPQDIRNALKDADLTDRLVDVKHGETYRIA